MDGASQVACVGKVAVEEAQQVVVEVVASILVVGVVFIPHISPSSHSFTILPPHSLTFNAYLAIGDPCTCTPYLNFEDLKSEEHCKDEDNDALDLNMSGWRYVELQRYGLDFGQST